MNETHMKPFLMCFYAISFILIANCHYSQNMIPHSGNSNKNVNKLKRDSTEIEYFNPEPETIFKPKIIIPDSLLPIKHVVKIAVRVEINSSGEPFRAVIVKSTDKRFNNIAIKLALKYRFKPLILANKKESVFVNIPLVFQKTK